MSKAIRVLLLCVMIAGYASIAYGAGNANAGKTKSAACAGCHGKDGNSIAPTFPRLAGQHGKYVSRQLSDFKNQKRNDPTMQAMSAGLSDQDIEDLSAFYAGEKPDDPKSAPQPKDGSEEARSVNKELIDTGKTLFIAGNEKVGVAACSGCHGTEGQGNGPAGFPGLKAQFMPYLIKALNDFKDNLRGNDEGAVMRTIAARMSKAEIAAVSAYLANLR